MDQKMKNVSKTVISREDCKNNILRLAKSELVSDVILFAVMLLIFVPLIFASLYVARYILILGIVSTLVCLIAPIIFICRIFRDFLTLKAVENDKFSVVKDTVSRLSKGEIPKCHSEGKHSVNAIYFEKHGRYAPAGTAFEISSVGDEFFLVVLNMKTEKTVLAFHSEVYEYKS